MQQFLICVFGCFCGVGVGWYVFFRQTKIINMYIIKGENDERDDDTRISNKDANTIKRM